MAAGSIINDAWLPGSRRRATTSLGAAKPPLPSLSLITQHQAIVWGGEELGAKFEEVEIPDDLKDKAAEYREKLIELVVELDDAVRGGPRPEMGCLTGFDWGYCLEYGEAAARRGGP